MENIFTEHIRIHDSYTKIPDVWEYVNIVVDQVHPNMTRVISAEMVFTNRIIYYVIGTESSESSSTNISVTPQPCHGLQIHLTSIQYSSCGPIWKTTTLLPRNTRELQDQLVNAWQLTPQITYKHFGELIPHHVLAVLKAVIM